MLSHDGWFCNGGSILNFVAQSEPEKQSSWAQNH